MPTEHWRIGDVSITKVVERELSIPVQILTQMMPSASLAQIEELRWLEPHYVHNDLTNVGYYSFLIETPVAKIVVDTGVGNAKSRTYDDFNRLETDYDANFRAVWDPDRVDLVVSTHLHVDHVGWNTWLVGGEWIPRFDRADYCFVEQEYRHWKRFADDNDPVNATLDVVAVFEDSVRPIDAAGLARFVASDTALTPEVRLLPSHGHTPGHVSVVVESRSERAVITGDLMHSPCQIGHPEWSSVYDTDPDASAVTRRAFLERFADTGTLVIGTHFGTPTGVTVNRDGPRFRLTPVG
ncbi:MBL fold metallo-hydrolase [Mycobacterium sp. B14F4]|uniref:MBL fold metallo-hydrolase n=1 Tax=Mycobacterium sp. B14F4 TaxID=3153565 RepID=UPI00325EF77D